MGGTAADELDLGSLPALEARQPIRYELVDCGPRVAGALHDPAVANTTPQPDALSRAEDYAVLYPLFAVRIRAAGGVAPGLDVTPPGLAIVETLVNGTSLLLSALDQFEQHVPQAA